MNARELQFLEVCLKVITQTPYNDLPSIDTPLRFVLEYNNELWHFSTFESLNEYLEMRTLSPVSMGRKFEMKLQFTIDSLDFHNFIKEYQFHALRDIKSSEHQKLAIFNFIKDLIFDNVDFKNYLPVHIPIDKVFNVVNITHGYSLPFMEIPQDAEIKLVSIN